MQTIAALRTEHVDAIIARIGVDSRRGRPWSQSLRQRVLLVCAALRTNLTFRELAAVFGISKSAAHRIVATLTPRLAGIARPCLDRRFSWIVDGT